MNNDQIKPNIYLVTFRVYNGYETKSIVAKDIHEAVHLSEQMFNIHREQITGLQFIHTELPRSPAPTFSKFKF